jgi:hypothetical protein
MSTKANKELLFINYNYRMLSKCSDPMTLSLKDFLNNNRSLMMNTNKVLFLLALEFLF